MWVFMKKRLVIDEVEYPVKSYVDMPDDVYHWVRSRKDGHEFVELQRDFELERIAGEQYLEEPPKQNLVPQSRKPCTLKSEINTSELSEDELVKLVEKIGGTVEIFRGFPSAWHPDRRCEIPSWLPNWNDKSYYAKLAETTDPEYETEAPAFAKQLEPNILFECRHIKPGTLKMQKSPTPKADFAWEFLRRNPIYQVDFKKLVILAKKEEVFLAEEHPAKKEEVFDYYSFASGFNIHNHEDTPPPSLLFHANLYRTLSRWGFGYWLPNPVDDLREVPALHFLSRLGNTLYPTERVAYFDNEPIPMDGGITPNDSEIWWLLDASRSMDSQLRDIKIFLEQTQKQYDKKPSASKTSVEAYISYIQTLDALAAGANVDEIENNIFAHIENLRYHEKSRQYSNPRHDAAYHAIKTALHLMKEGYKTILPPA